MIFKVQLPLGGDMELALVYNRNRSVMHQPPIADVEHLFPPGQKKIYVEGSFLNGVINLNNAVVARDW